MKPILFFILGAALLYSTGCSAAGHDFDSVVSGIEHRYSVHPQHIPLLGFASLCATVTTRGGVRGMRIAEFDNIQSSDGAADLSALLQSKLGGEWQPFVSQRNADASERSIIFVQPVGDAMRMLIADYDHGELDLVRMELNGSALAKWMHDPASQGRSASHGYHSGQQTD